MKGRIACALAACLAAGAAPCAGADFPNHPMKIIVPYPPGGATDIVSRVAGEVLHERLGQPVIVENRPGADAVIGLDALARSAPDGHTLGIMPGASLVTLPVVKKSLPFDPLADFAPLSMVFRYPQIIMVNSELPVKSLAELIAYVRANPGKVNRAVVGTGSMLQSTMTDVALGIQGQTVIVNYKGSSLSATAMQSNEVQLMNMDPTLGLPALKSGKVRALAVTTPQRLAVLPEVPTVAEAASPGFELTSVFGFFAPAKTPRETVQKLSEEFTAMAKSGPVNDYIVNKIGAMPVGSTAEEFAQWLRADFAREKAAAQVAKVQPE
ncbi:MAG TPA: tripartite tricarboxylate transporter substrate binding protein [Burkholderiales bacterium]|nr:tripartite tricarboxylate transporter substrate binding protein [Burkholderiales bacterium]